MSTPARKYKKQNYAKAPRKPSYAPPSRTQKAKKVPVRKNPAPGLLSAGGGLLGGALMGPMGAKLGSMAGGLISTLTGFGDYEVQSNSLHPGLLEGDVPQVVNSKNRGGVIIRHREYISDIQAATTFTQQQVFLNPGLTASFPWLANIAAAYEEYEFRGLVFEFKSLSSDSILSASTSSALGFVAMATQYNPANGPFYDKHELDNYEFANSRKPSESFCHAVECKRRLNFDTHLFIRNGAVPAGQDQKTFDLGATSIAVGGCQAATGVLGELWCTYEIEFFHPKYKYNAETLSDHFQRVGFSTAVPLGVPYANPAGPTGSNLGCVVTGTSITFPSFATGGQYLVTIVWNGTTAAAVTTPGVGFIGCGPAMYHLGDGSNQIISPPPVVTTSLVEYWVIQPQAGSAFPASINLATTGGIFPTGTQFMDIWVTEISSTIVR